MPRRTHPRFKRKHPRGIQRANTQRVINRRMRQARMRYDGSYYSEYNDLIRAGTVPDRSMWLLWPFNRPRNDWSNNPFTRCSCAGCQGWDEDPARRQRERAQWEREVLDAY